MFKAGPAKPAGKNRTTSGQRIYAKEVKVKETAKYEDVKQYIKEQRDALRELDPNIEMNVAIKYAGVRKPMSGGFFKVSGDYMDLKAPYDYHDDGDTIEYIYIQYA